MPLQVSYEQPTMSGNPSKEFLLNGSHNRIFADPSHFQKPSTSKEKSRMSDHQNDLAQRAKKNLSFLDQQSSENTSLNVTRVNPLRLSRRVSPINQYYKNLSPPVEQVDELP